MSPARLPASIGALRQLYSTLAEPESAHLPGRWRASFVGPGWLRASAPTAIALGGMPGWWGKQLAAGGQGFNLRRRGAELSPTLALVYGQAPSLVDGRACLAVRYPPGSPFPWTLVVDELRQLERGCLLGLTIVNRGLLKRLAFPFLLEREG